MPSLDELSAEKRAILELILARDQTYDDVAGTLDLPASRVRELGHEALAALAPSEARRLDPESLGRVADYLLGEQSAGEAKSTRALLRRSSTARAWASSTLDFVGHLYDDGAEPFVPERRPRNGGSARSVTEGSAKTAPHGRPAARWRTIAIAALLVGVGALVALGIVLVTDDAAETDGQLPASAADGPRVLARLDLRPLGDTAGSASALLLDLEGGRQMFVKGQLPPTRGNDVYRFWLLNSPEDAVPIATEATDKTGHFEANGPLPDDFENYRYLNVSRESSEEADGHSGDSVLEAPLWRRRLAHFFGRL